MLPLYELLKRRVLASPVIHTDDTSVEVLDATLPHTRTGRFWAYVGDLRNPYVVYDFTPSRGSQVSTPWSQAQGSRPLRLALSGEVEEDGGSAS